MASVTQRIKQIKQPKGGYVTPKQFTVIQKSDSLSVDAPENIHASLIGLAVDYLTRYMLGADIMNAFHISILGARRVNELSLCQDLLNQVDGLSDNSIRAACQLAGFDSAFRAGPAYYKPVSGILPDSSTIEHIRIMVNSSLSFWAEYGPVVKDGFTFEGGYTNFIDSGDGDFLTEDTLWDFKVSVSAPKNTQTLQLLIYYLMGTHSTCPEFKTIKRLGIFNPRLNNIYLLDISSIPTDVIQEVSSVVIGYN